MHSLKEAKAVFFDLDDTLYDSLSPFQKSLEYHELCLPSSSVEEFYKQVRHYSDVLWKFYVTGDISLEELRVKRLTCAMHDFGLSITTEQAISIQERYEVEQKLINPFPSIYSLLQELQARNVIVGIMTNGPIEHQSKKLKALQLDQLISKDLIFISDGIGIAKPDQRVFEYVHSKINIEANKCLYIGDTWENDIVAPIEAGWMSIWFNHRNRLPQSHHVPNETFMSDEEFLQLKF